RRLLVRPLVADLAVGLASASVSTVPYRWADYVVRRLHGQLYFVYEGLLNRYLLDPHHQLALVQLVAGTRPDVEHGLAQAADELVGDDAQRAAVGHPALDPLRDDLVVVGDVTLEVAVLGVGDAPPAGLHGPQAAHPPVGLVLLAVDVDQVSGALVAAGQERADHDRVRARHEGFGDVTGVLQAAVADHRNARGGGGLGGLVDRGDLRHPHPGHDPGGA